MPRIQQLPPHVVARIAAGEVVERPASVLKELLENSIDAGATRIDIEIGKGGLEYLRVVDDGCGIDAADLALAFAPHATSKLRSADDLPTIGTLGFRGEGLASIGAVSQACLQSRLADAAHGYEIRCDGGRLSDVRPWNGAPGTRIEVRNLFYNTPVRRKFLRGPATEMGHVAEAFTRVALSQLSLHLTLKHNGRLTYEVPRSAGLLDRVGLFFGDEVRGRLRGVEADGGDGMVLGGYVADPSCESGGTQMQYLFVNGRWVRDRGVSLALLEAYRGLLLTGKHPVAFLFLEVPHDAVDVNVHPTKSEVRFRQPDKVRQFVLDAARQALQAADLTTALRAPRAAPPPRQPDLPLVAAPAPEARRRTENAPPPAAAQATTRTPQTAPPPPPTVPTQRPTPAPAEERSSPPSPPHRPVKAMQMHDLYLVVEEPDGILVIDQHALHERILFERLKARHADGKVSIQKLLAPEPVTLPPAQAALLLEHRDALQELGLEVGDFGGGTVLLGGYPAVLGRRQPRAILQAVVEQLLSREAPPGREVMLNDLLALMACHSAVRAGDRLTPQEVQELLGQRHLAKDSHHCPHGRPSSLLFTKRDLDRQFRRLG